MGQKYTDARYPEKINDLIDNEGSLSEEGKKAIEESGVETKDPRLPELTPEDVGKMLSVDEEGNYKLVDAPSGGTKLYKHSFCLSDSSAYPSNSFNFDVITTTSTPVTTFAEATALLSQCISYKGGFNLTEGSSSYSAIIAAFNYVSGLNSLFVYGTYYTSEVKWTQKSKSSAYLYGGDKVTEL